MAPIPSTAGIRAIRSTVNTVGDILNVANGIATQVDANTVTLDFGAGDILTVNSGEGITLADLNDDVTIV